MDRFLFRPLETLLYHSPFEFSILIRTWNGNFCFVQEKEYKDALDAANEKNKEKVQLVTRLMEV